MSDQYLGEIRMFAGNYAPMYWAFCDGQLLSISENEALYTLIGTTYGGDGRTTFALPDLRGRIPIHMDPSTYPLGSKSGTEHVTLTTNQLPAHTHLASAISTAGHETTPSNALWATSTTTNFAKRTSAPVQMNHQALSHVGGNQPHDNMMPSITISFIIALAGIFPSQG